MKQRVLVVESVGEPNVDLLPEEMRNAFFATLLNRIAELVKEDAHAV